MIELAGPWLQTGLGIVAAGAATGAAIEAYRTRQLAETNSRALFGDEKTPWKGLVERNKEHREVLQEEEKL